ncbi:MAG: signal peptidase II [Dehalococcoidia bacterium]|nr:signal peptidase II [Dehalococcoidia bacterium]
MQIPSQQEQEGLTDPQETTTAATEPTTLVESKPKLPPSARSWFSEMYVATLLVATFALDQITKGWVRSHLLLGESIPEQGLFRITHTFNTGSAFGLFPNQTVILTLASVVGIGILLLFLRKQSVPGIWLHTSLGLQLGGAAGNLVDRLTMGRVTDFIQIGIWPVFNLADSSIVIGLAILAWFLFRSPKETPAATAVIHEAQQEPSQDEAPATGPLPDSDPGGEERR